MASDMIASELMSVAALGRPFTIGMLYDARNDELIPGLTLWDANTLQDNTIESPQPYSKFNISASDTIESKSSLLDVEASLKASFMGGLIEVGGSAKYLNDQKKFKNQSRVTCQYKTTTIFKQLAVNDLQTAQTQQIDVIKKGLATHVVTGILYGANAFFVFDSEKVEASKVQDIQGHMEAVIKKIPSFSIEGSADLKMTDKEKAMTEKFSCKFYGDFILDSNPATFKEAVQTYLELPKLLAKNYEKVVPMKVWLMPLRNFDSDAAELTNEISIGLVREMQDALEDLREMEMRCNDSLEEKEADKFPQIRKDLRHFQEECGYYVANIKQTMKEKLPSIREGKEDESSLKQLFEDRDNSPFSHDKLSKWLDGKEREMNIIGFCLDIMKGTEIVTNRSQLDREVLSPGVDTLCFVFTSLDKTDPCLDEMENYLETSESGCTMEDPWYFSNEVLIKMREKAKEFHGFVKAQKNNPRFSFLIAAIENEKFPGATIYHYNEGILVSEDFSKPDLPPVETITDRKAMIPYACDLNLDPNTANYKLTLSEGNKKATNGASQSYPDHRDRFDQETQVLCKEALSGRHYWEVEWSSSSQESVYICLAYSGVQRKGNNSDTEMGDNDKSWSFGKSSWQGSGGLVLRAYHKVKLLEVPFPSDCNKVGVYLDWPAGTLSFYKVSSNTLSHLFTFRNKFTEPVYPGLWARYESNYAYLCPFE